MPEAQSLDKAEEKPLLPKNFCWTWPCSTWGWVFWGLGTLSLGYGVISSLAAFDVGGFPLAIIGLIVMGFASANPFATMMKDFVPGASENSPRREITVDLRLSAARRGNAGLAPWT